MASGDNLRNMDYMFILVMLFALSLRITCVPLQVEMMGMDPGARPTNQNDATLTGSGSSSMAKAVPKSPVQKDFGNAVNNIIPSTQSSQPNTDIGLGILDNPLLGQQLDALLASKPLNLVGPFSAFQNPAFEAQLNKMFGSLPLGSMTSLSFLNNPVIETQPGELQGTGLVNSQDINFPVLDQSPMRVPETVMTSKALHPHNRVSSPRSSSKAVKPKLPPPPPATETDPFLLEAGIADIGPSPASKPEPVLPVASSLQGIPKMKSTVPDKTFPPALDKPKPVNQGSLVAASGDIQGIHDLKGQVMDPTLNLPLGSIEAHAKPSEPSSFGSSHGPLMEMIPDMTVGALTQDLKAQGPRDEIGATLNEMSKMINSQDPLGIAGMEWGTPPVAEHLMKGGTGIMEGRTPLGMAMLNTGTRGLTQQREPVGAPWLPSAGPEKESLPSQIDLPWSKDGGSLKQNKPSLNTSWLKKDLGALVVEPGPAYTEKKQKPVETVCSLKDLYAICNLVGNPSKPDFRNVTGTIYLRQLAKKDCNYDWLNIQVDISNAPMNDGTLFHGMHIHQYGEMTNGCEGMGPHYNPLNTPHGAPWQPERLRHVGDLGNVRQRRRDGKIYTRIVDYVAKLHGPESIIGRGMVLKTGRDDLGQSSGDSSKVTGNSGEMMACCVISRSRPHTDDLYTLY